MSQPIPQELLALQRLASVAQVGGFRPPSTPRSSWTGGVLLGAPGETWPESGGRPLWPACQILVEELPAAPPAALADVALLTLFFDLVDMPYEHPRGERWELRTYPTTDGLVPLVEPEREVSGRRPEEDFQVRPFPVLWRPRTELPSDDDVPFDLQDVWEEFQDATEYEDGGPLDLSGLKVGGWPQTIQSEVEWYLGDQRVDDAEFVLQVDSDEKTGFVIVGSGTAYVGWSPTVGWVLTAQMY